jgi:hypothetical protein
VLTKSLQHPGYSEHQVTRSKAKGTFNIIMEKSDFLQLNWKVDDFLISQYSETSLCKAKQVPVSANNRQTTQNYEN